MNLAFLSFPDQAKLFLERFSNAVLDELPK
jgi:hypothetical protein